MIKENKKRINITLTPKSHEKIKRYAKKKHTYIGFWSNRGLDLERIRIWQRKERRQIGG